MANRESGQLDLPLRPWKRERNVKKKERRREMARRELKKRGKAMKGPKTRPTASPLRQRREVYR